jgi:hypothetical protein
MSVERKWDALQYRKKRGNIFKKTGKDLVEEKGDEKEI